LRILTVIFAIAAMATGWFAFGTDVNGILSLGVDITFIASIAGFLICFLILLSSQLRSFVR
jgi:hypothetical protein